MESIIDSSLLPDSLREWSDLETMLFDISESSANSIIDYIKKHDNFSKDAIISLLYKVVCARRFNYKPLSRVFFAISEDLPNNFCPTSFLAYLKYTKYYESEPSSYYLERIDASESVFHKESLGYALCNEDIERIIYLSASNDFTKQNIAYEDYEYDMISFAALRKAINIFKYLMINGSPLTKMTARCAVSSGSSEIIEICVQHGLSFDNTFPDAVINHQNETAHWLLANNYKLSFNLHMAISHFNSQVLYYFVQRSLQSDPNKNILLDHNLISSSVVSANIQALKYLISEGFEYEYRENSTDLTPLIIASRFQRKDILTFLLEQGSKTNQKDEWVSLLFIFKYNIIQIFDIIIFHFIVFF